MAKLEFHDTGLARLQMSHIFLQKLWHMLDVRHHCTRSSLACHGTVFLANKDTCSGEGTE